MQTYRITFTSESLQGSQNYVDYTLTPGQLTGMLAIIASYDPNLEGIKLSVITPQGEYALDPSDTLYESKEFVENSDTELNYASLAYAARLKSYTFDVYIRYKAPPLNFAHSFYTSDSL